ncbi:hypothetical protein GC175_24485 [bacterium]|nr:hypothetical protein [bacterium]
MEDTLLPSGLSSGRAGTLALLNRSLLTTAYRPALLTLMLVGFLFRIALLTAFPFREDEAIYSFWALHITRVDPLMLSVWPDKPPVFLWLLGGTFSILGAGEAQARLFNIAVSILTVAVVAATARTFWGKKTALICALFFALNPFAIGFSATAFTDPLLVLFGVLAFHAAVTRRPLWAGVWLALAIMTKQQGILYVPLILAMIWQLKLSSPTATLRHHPILSSSYRLLISFLGAALALIPILLWDAARWHVAPSPWDLSVRNYGGFALSPLVEWPARLKEWGSLLWYLTGSTWVWGLAALCLIAMPFRRTREKRITHHLFISSTLLLWSFGFLAFHLATTTQTWDRYLLPLTPFFALGIALLLARTLSLLPGNRTQLAAVVLAAVLLFPPAWTAAQGRIPIGGDRGGYAGLHEVINWLDNEAPPGSVLYHRLLGWHYRFYFFDDSSSAHNRFDLRWYPNSVYLADNAAKIGHESRFLVMPEWVSLRNWERDLAVRHIAAVERLRAGRFVLYELTGPPQEYCDWCFSRPSAE